MFIKTKVHHYKSFSVFPVSHHVAVWLSLTFPSSSNQVHWASNGMDNIHVHITKTINYVVLMNMYTVIAVYCKHALQI